VQLSGEVEADEAYVVTGHKGMPAEVAKAGRKGRRRRLKGKRRGTLSEDMPPVLGLLQRDGEVVIRMLPNVQQVTIKPVITSVVALELYYTPMNTIFTTAYLRGAMNVRALIILLVSMPVMKTEMVFMKSMSTPLKVFGLCYVPGCGHIGEFHKKDCHGTWASSSSYTMSVVVERRCFTHSLPHL
jgi:hypothetical protein